MNRDTEIAERVAEAAREQQIDLVVIGGAALAAHHYVRATLDFDFASVVDPYRDLPRLQAALRDRGLNTELRQPDDEDPLGGLLRVWTLEDEDGDPIEPVEVVNFKNPHRPIPLPTTDLIRDAIEMEGEPDLRYVSLPHLILLKLYGGDFRGRGDAVEVLLANPDADLEAIRALCKRWHFDAIDPVIDEVLRKRKAHGVARK